MKQFQNKIKQFDEARGWGDSWNVKDLCLNMTEEIGELWNLIKWVDDEKQKRIIVDNREEAGNFVGDVSFLILKIANQLGVDAEEELKKVLEEYERRMPAEKMKEVLHANKLAGGVDEK
jgi:NTP pyrophosphatase (non-canonical NTP hydrolase)